MYARQLKDLKRIQTKQLQNDAERSMRGKDTHIEHLNRKKEKDEEADAWTYTYWWSEDNVDKEKARRELQDLAIWMIRQGEGTGYLAFHWVEKDSISNIENKIRDKFNADKDPVEYARQNNSSEDADALITYFDALRSEGYSHPSAKIKIPDEVVEFEIGLLNIPFTGKAISDRRYRVDPVLDVAVGFGSAWQSNDIYRFVKNRNQSQSADWVCSKCGMRSDDPEKIDKHGVNFHENFDWETDRREFVGKISNLIENEEVSFDE